MRVCAASSRNTVGGFGRHRQHGDARLRETKFVQSCQQIRRLVASDKDGSRPTFAETRFPINTPKLVWSPLKEKLRRRLQLVLASDFRQTSATEHCYFSRDDQRTTM